MSVKHGGENPIIGHFSLVASEELVNLQKGFAPRFNKVENVAPRQLNVFRARYVIGDILAHYACDEWVVGVLDDKGGHADGGKDRARSIRPREAS